MRWILTLLHTRSGIPCVVRVMWAIVFAHLLFLSGYALYKGQSLDFAADARAWCEFLGAASIGIAGKALTEK